MSSLEEHILAHVDENSQSQQASHRRRKRAKPEKPIKLISLPQLPPIRLQLADRQKELVSDAAAMPTKLICFPANKTKSSFFGSQLACVTRVIELVYQGLASRSVQTKRDLYYKDVNTFAKQTIVDQIVDDLAATIGCSRFDLGVVASSKGVFHGPITISTSQHELLDGQAGMMLIPPHDTITDIDLSSIDFVVVIEKEVRFY